MDAAVMQETNFVCNIHACVMFHYFVIFSAYGVRLASCVFLLVKRTLNARVALVHIDPVSRMIVAYISVKMVRCGLCAQR